MVITANVENQITLIHFFRTIFQKVTAVYIFIKMSYLFTLRVSVGNICSLYIHLLLAKPKTKTYSNLYLEYLKIKIRWH